MINIRTIKKMQDGDTLNLKNGNIKRYKGGYEVVVATMSTTTPEDAIKWMKFFTRLVRKNCQIQFKDGKYHVNSTEHAYTKPQAKELAEKFERSITYEWKNLAHMAI